MISTINKDSITECPACKHNYSIHRILLQSPTGFHADSNINNPGYWLDDYYVCKKCGIMYKILNKKDNE